MIRLPDSASTPVVGSSRISTGASRTIARAIAIRCRCPPESLLPFWPISVSYPSVSAEMNS